MHGREKSDRAIVAMKAANKAGSPVAESLERRARTEGNAIEPICVSGSEPAQCMMSVGSLRPCWPPSTRGGSRMRESRTYGSVRGALSNERPYRDHLMQNYGDSALSSARARE